MRVATQDLPRSAAHPFYARLNQILDTHYPSARSRCVLETGAIGGVTVQDADDGDTTTSIETLIDAAERVEAVRPYSGERVLVFILRTEKPCSRL